MRLNYSDVIKIMLPNAEVPRPKPQAQ